MVKKTIKKVKKKAPVKKKTTNIDYQLKSKDFLVFYDNTSSLSSRISAVGKKCTLKVGQIVNIREHKIVGDSLLLMREE